MNLNTISWAIIIIIIIIISLMAIENLQNHLIF